MIDGDGVLLAGGGGVDVDPGSAAGVEIGLATGIGEAAAETAANLDLLSSSNLFSSR